MPISSHLGTLQKDGRLHKELLQDGQDGLSWNVRVFLAFLMDHFLLLLCYLLFFICSEREHQRCLSSVSEKDI